MRDFTPVYKCLDELEAELNIKEEVIPKQPASDALAHPSAPNGSQTKHDGDSESIDAELIQQIKRVQNIENLTYEDVVYYTKDFDEFYAQILFSNYPSDPFYSSPTIGEEQNKLLREIVRLWEIEHGDYDDYDGWYPTDDAQRPLWFDKYRRILTIEKGSIPVPDYEEEPIKYNSKRFHSLLSDYFSKLTDEEFVELIKTRRPPLPLLEEVVSKREYDELKGCINNQNAEYEFLEQENKSLKEINEQLWDKIKNGSNEHEDESANCTLTTRRCVALATEFKLRSKINTEDEINNFFACLTGKSPSSFHNYWSDTSSVQSKAKIWAKEQKGKVLAKKNSRQK